MNTNTLLNPRIWRWWGPLLVALAGASVGPAQEVELESGFRWLFDGRSLDRWEGNLEYFRVQDGAIVAGRLDKPIPRNEFLCTQEQFGDFELILDVKLVGSGKNAGIQFRSERVPNSSEVRGYQCDVGEAWSRPVWGALYDESRRRKMLAEGPADQLPGWVRDGDWNTLRIWVQGDRIRLFVNGHQTVDYRETDDGIPRTGIIGLQIHEGPPSEAWYRNLRIKTIGSR